MFPTDSNLETEFTFETKGNVVSDEPPFHLLLFGNWSGTNNSLLTDIGLNRPISIDRDNFDEIMAKFNVGLDLDLNDNNSLSLKFTSLDDFHPDNLFRQVSLFQDLRDLRRKLQNENTFNEAANEVRSWFDLNSPDETFPSETSDISIDSNENSPSSVNLLDSILSQTEVSSVLQPSKTTPSSELSRFLSKIVKSHIVKTDENEQARLTETVDEATGNLMRSILHHSKFQELEAAWRGVYLLIRKIPTDSDLKIFLLDLSKEQLVSNLKSVNNLADTNIYRWLVKETIETPGGEPWAVVCGNYTFGLNVDDVATLIRLAKLCQTANAPFISYILPEMFGFSSIANAPQLSSWKTSEDSTESKLWATLRSLPESSYLGLSLPRFLARLPYGKSTDPTETFSFEEFKEVSEHNNYLWANPSFLCGLLLAQTYDKYKWEMSHNFQLSFSDLPTHIYQENGETKTKPCAEILMTDDICQRILEEGIMPLISYKNSDMVRLGRFQSITDPVKGLSGRWK